MLVRRRLAWGLALHLAVIIVVGTLAYVGGLPFRVQELHPSGDKVMHFLLVGGLAFWLVGLWNDARLSRGPLGRLRLPLAVVVPGVLAGLEEGLQFFSSRRNADWLDLAADLAGLVTFWILGRLLQGRLDDRDDARDRVAT